jgi:hypothetical protein
LGNAIEKVSKDEISGEFIEIFEHKETFFGECAPMK